MNPGDPRMDGWMDGWISSTVSSSFIYLPLSLFLPPMRSNSGEGSLEQSENPGSSSTPCLKAACHCVFRIRPIEPRNSVNGVCIDHRLDPLPAENSTANRLETRLIPLIPR